jgi:hypothetical protein
MNGKSLFAAIAMAATAYGSTAALAVEVPAASLTQDSASEQVVKTAAPKASASYTKAMVEELKEAEEAQKLMPYLLALHVDGQTSDGVTVRLNVPVKFMGVSEELAKGLFPKGDDEAGHIRLMQAYNELEGVFSEELDKMSQHFPSTDFYQPMRSVAHRCDVGSDEVCEALKAPLQAALQRAQAGKPYTLHIVHEWVNFYGLFNLGAAEASNTQDLPVAKAVAERF